MVFGPAKGKVSPSDALANLVLAMHEDQQLRDIICRAIALGGARKQFIDDLVVELSKNGAPKSVLQSVAILADDDICARLKLLLIEES